MIKILWKRFKNSLPKLRTLVKSLRIMYPYLTFILGVVAYDLVPTYILVLFLIGAGIGLSVLEVYVEIKDSTVLIKPPRKKFTKKDPYGRVSMDSADWPEALIYLNYIEDLHERLGRL